MITLPSHDEITVSQSTMSSHHLPCHLSSLTSLFISSSRENKPANTPKKRDEMVDRETEKWDDMVDGETDDDEMVSWSSTITSLIISLLIDWTALTSFKNLFKVSSSLNICWIFFVPIFLYMMMMVVSEMVDCEMMVNDERCEVRWDGKSYRIIFYLLFHHISSTISQSTISSVSQSTISSVSQSTITHPWDGRRY